MIIKKREVVCVFTCIASSCNGIQLACALIIKLMRVNNIVVFVCSCFFLSVQSFMFSKETTTVMVFGVFDLLHEGHRAFLNQAVACGSRLIIVVTPDSVVQLLKKRVPHDNQIQRMRNVKAVIDGEVVLGDTELGTYEVIKKYCPDIICLGYDQVALERDLRQRMAAGSLPAMLLLTLKAYKPELYHTSLLLKVSKGGESKHA